MIKRIFAIFLVLALTAPAFFSAVVFAGKGSEDPFSFYDARRDAILAGEYAAGGTDATPQPDGDKSAYIVTFSSGATPDEIYGIISPYAFRPLAYSSQRVFLLWLGDGEAFYAENAGAIASFEPDSTLSLCEETLTATASAELWELDRINAYGAFDIAQSADFIIIALLDSGIDRAHPALAEANILDGFDMTNKYAKVESDKSGHGTKVAGIVAAAAGVTSARGIALGAAVLPIRISDNGNDIKTSDLVEAIYLAADAGADVINMSFGGYEKVQAEEDACAYAAGKGCILVAAAGNEGGSRDFAGCYSYPASYDGVISVGSVGQNDVICSFSQYNDRVDVAAPGEYLTLLGNNGGVTYDNGTSFSAAYVTAAAALALSYAGRSFGSDTFARLLEYSCGSGQRDDYRGYGVLDLKALLECCRLPVVYGVTDGETYFDRVTVVFEGSSAMLDGEEFISGSDIYTYGAHTLEVTNNFGSRSVSFTLDTVKLSFSYQDHGAYSTFSFKRGTAEIDGFPYVSGTVYDTPGSHTFVLTGPNGNTTEKSFTVPAAMPEIAGVADGGIYDRYVRITAAGEGKTYIDGTRFYAETFVLTNGKHTLRLENANGSETKTVTFTIKSGNTAYMRTFTKNAEMCVDEQNGFAAFYERGGISVLLVPLKDINSEGRLIITGYTIYDVASVGGRLIIAHSLGYSSLDASALFINDAGRRDFLHSSRFTSAVIVGSTVYYTDASGSLYRIGISGAELTTAAETGITLTRVMSGGGKLWLYSPDGLTSLYSYNPASGRVSGPYGASECGEPLAATDKYIFCTSGAISTDTQKCVFRYDDTQCIPFCSDSVVATQRYLMKTDGTVIGIYDGAVSSIYTSEHYAYLLLANGRAFRIDRAAYKNTDAVYYGAAGNTDTAEAQPYRTSRFDTLLPLASGRKAFDMEWRADRLYVLYEGENKLAVYSKELVYLYSVSFLYKPAQLAVSDGGVFVRFENAAYIWSDRTGYVSLPFSPTALAAGDNSLYMISNERLYAMSLATYIPVAVLRGMTPDSIAVSDSMLYVASAFDLSAFSLPALKLTASSDSVLGSGIAYSGGRLLSGSYVLDADTLAFVTACGTAALAANGNAVMTGKGLYSIQDEKYISRVCSGAEAVCFAPDGSAYIALGGYIRLIASENGDLCSGAGFGVSSGSVIAAGDGVTYSRGAAYLDGEPYVSGTAINDGGSHTLVSVMPWGIRESVNFGVRPQPEGLTVAVAAARLKIGDVTYLKYEILPRGADGRVTYSVDGESVTVDAGGVVTAVDEGTSVVTATLVGTDITATVRITVSDDVIVCLDPSLIYDEENDYISGVVAGTTVDRLTAVFSCSVGSLEIRNREGHVRSSGAVSTLCELVRVISGVVTERIVISVIGDIDCDGAVTVNDADMLYRCLRSDSEIDGAIFRAADITGNGRLTAADLSRITAMLSSGKKGIATAEHAGFDIPAFAYGGSTLPVTVVLGGLTGASSFMATLRYDSSALEYLSSSYYEGSVSVRQSDGSLFFTALGTDESDDDRIIKVYFRAKASSGVTSVRLTDTLLCSGELYSASDTAADIELRGNPSSSLVMSSDNTDLSFTQTVTFYSLSVLENESIFDLRISCPAGGLVYCPPLALTGDVSEYTVKYISPSGGTSSYDFIVTKAKELPEPRSTALLKYLTVGEAELSPAFDPETYLYTASVAAETESIGFDYDPENKGVRVALEGPETLSAGSNIFTLRCTAEGGDTTVYTVIVRRPPDMSSESSEEPSSEPVSEIPIVSEEENSNQSVAESSAAQSAPPEGIDIGAVAAATGIAAVAVAAGIAIAIIRKKKSGGAG